VTSGYPAPRDATLVFYCPNGYILSDPGAIGIAAGLTPADERVAPGQAQQDYDLQKYQGYHNDLVGPDKETYAFIQQGAHDLEGRRKVVETTFTGRFKEDTLKQIRKLEMDVVTVRNREFHKPPTLYELVDALEKAGFHYREIHCSFCRCPADVEKPPQWLTGSNKIAPGT
jgi:hypothetical protein